MQCCRDSRKSAQGDRGHPKECGELLAPTRHFHLRSSDVLFLMGTYGLEGVTAEGALEASGLAVAKAMFQILAFRQRSSVWTMCP